MCDLKAGDVLKREMLDVLRPAPQDAIMPTEIPVVLGKRLLVDLPKGKEFKWVFLGE